MKFRANRTDTGEAVEGDLIHCMKFSYIQNIDNPPPSGYGGPIQIDPSTLQVQVAGKWFTEAELEKEVGK